jgi:adenosylmethionine-8-amino-7-oxononanoate aminotransferase
MEQASGIEETRSCGMIGAIDMAWGPSAAEVCQVAREKGLLTRHIRNTVTLMPPLIVSTGQLERALDILKESIQIVVSRTGNRRRSLE